MPRKGQTFTRTRANTIIGLTTRFAGRTKDLQHKSVAEMREIIKREDPELESGIADTMLRLWCKEMDITLGRGNQYTSKSKTNKKEVESLKARMDSVEEKLEALIDLLGGTQKIETPRQTNLPHINA